MLHFTKMNGAGNDFVVIDNRDDALHPGMYADVTLSAVAAASALVVGGIALLALLR